MQKLDKALHKGTTTCRGTILLRPYTSRGARIWCPLIAGLLLAAGWLLAACGSGAGSSSQQITFMLSSDPVEAQAYESLVAAFEAKYPDIDVQMAPIPGDGEYNQRLAAQFAAGKPPDVLLLNYRRYPLFATAGSLEALGPYLAASDQLAAEDFYPQTVEAFTLDGRLWCLPQNISSLVIYYNHDLFAAAGLPDPSPAWTMDDFLAAARQLTRDLDGDGRIDQYGVGISPAWCAWRFHLAGGWEIVDDPLQPTRLTLTAPALPAFQWFVDLQAVEHVAPDRSAESANPAKAALNGRLGCFSTAGAAPPTVPSLRLPGMWLPATQRFSRQYSAQRCLLHGGCNSKQGGCLKFIEFANTLEGQTLMARTGRTVPSLVAVAESPAFLDPLQPPAASQVFLEVIPDLRRLPLLSTWPNIEEVANREIERAFYGEISVLEAAASAAALTQALFEQANQKP
jgi:multiple sugar transport system substrate-binding protein